VHALRVLAEQPDQPHQPFHLGGLVAARLTWHLNTLW
jgi:hypothetical protein